MHPRHGELLPNGYHVGDLVTYGRGLRFGHVIAGAVWDGPDTVRALFANSEEQAAERYFRQSGLGTTCGTSEARLIRNYEGNEPNQEGSSTMSEAQTTELTAEAQPEEVTEGQEYRVVYLRDYHNFEFTARALESRALGRGISMEITGWVRENSDANWDGETYPVGYRWVVSSEGRRTADPHVLILPLAQAAASTQEAAYDGQLGAFEPHNGQMPEPGTIVRAMHNGTANRQIEGLFLRMNSADPDFAWVDARRRRTKRADGTFSEWESYSTRAERSVVVEGAEVFKPGGSKPAETTWTRLRAITSSAADCRAEVGQIVSGMVGDHSGLLRGRGETENYFRGEVVDVSGYGGPYEIMATEVADVSNSAGRQRVELGGHNFRPLPEPRRVSIYAVFSDGHDQLGRAAYVWEKLEPGQKKIDPAFDPKRATTHTGMKIGDLVVALMRSNSQGRDGVSSWIKGELIKWDVRYSRPIVKITEPLESGKKVGDEVTCYSEDTYPAIADPANSDPAEFKKTLRLYLIGRHKHGDFCRGGLNTMLAAFGLPLYETRRRAKMLIDVEYDPNVVDIYGLRNQLRSNITGITSIATDERAAEDFEVESDVTIG